MSEESGKAGMRAQVFRFQACGSCWDIRPPLSGTFYLSPAFRDVSSRLWPLTPGLLHSVSFSLSSDCPRNPKGPLGTSAVGDTDGEGSSIPQATPCLHPSALVSSFCSALGGTGHSACPARCGQAPGPRTTLGEQVGSCGIAEKLTPPQPLTISLLKLRVSACLKGTREGFPPSLHSSCHLFGSMPLVPTGTLHPSGSGSGSRPPGLSGLSGQRLPCLSWAPQPHRRALLAGPGNEGWRCPLSSSPR